MELVLYSFVAWTLAQVIKVSTRYCRCRSFSFRNLFGSGDFPSAHTSFTSCLMLLVAFRSGLDSTDFALATTLWGVVAYDSFHSRLSIGQQAEALNRLGKQWAKEKGEDFTPIKVVKGHTLPEMAAGALLGWLTALLLHFIFKV